LYEIFTGMNWAIPMLHKQYYAHEPLRYWLTGTNFRETRSSLSLICSQTSVDITGSVVLTLIMNELNSGDRWHFLNVKSICSRIRKASFWFSMRYDLGKFSYSVKILLSLLIKFECYCPLLIVFIEINKMYIEHSLCYLVHGEILNSLIYNI
jgi:hypothetical protein